MLLKLTHWAFKTMTLTRLNESLWFKSCFNDLSCKNVQKRPKSSTWLFQTTAQCYTPLHNTVKQESTLVRHSSDQTAHISAPHQRRIVTLIVLDDRLHSEVMVPKKIKNNTFPCEMSSLHVSRSLFTPNILPHCACCWRWVAWLAVSSWASLALCATEGLALTMRKLWV